MWKFSDTFKRLHVAFAMNNFPSFCLKPKQVQCFEYLLQGFDVLSILPTGFGKSLLFQLLPDFLPVNKSSQNIVIVVYPLSSIIEDQISAMNLIGIPAEILPNIDEDSSYLYNSESLFDRKEDTNEQASEECKVNVSKAVIDGKAKLLFAHPEALLSTFGRKLLSSKVYQDNVPACVIDEAHCVELW
jgi:ATP-dependent DNA helicase RecQ